MSEKFPIDWQTIDLRTSLRRWAPFAQAYSFSKKHFFQRQRGGQIWNSERSLLWPRGDRRVSLQRSGCVWGVQVQSDAVHRGKLLQQDPTDRKRGRRRSKEGPAQEEIFHTLKPSKTKTTPTETVKEKIVSQSDDRNSVSANNRSLNSKEEKGNGKLIEPEKKTSSNSRTDRSSSGIKQQGKTKSVKA